MTIDSRPSGSAAIGRLRPMILCAGVVAAHHAMRRFGRLTIDHHGRHTMADTPWPTHHGRHTTPDVLRPTTGIAAAPPSGPLRQTQSTGAGAVNAMPLGAATNSDTVYPHGSAGANRRRPDSGRDNDGCRHWRTHNNSASISGAARTINAAGAYGRVGIVRSHDHGRGKRDDSTSNEQQWTHNRLLFCYGDQRTQPR
ncbi:MAG: hypothetical protein J0G37_12385, partial [Afipia sp.]|nr:hypothetical protein [Afipia sp.]